MDHIFFLFHSILFPWDTHSNYGFQNAQTKIHSHLHLPTNLRKVEVKMKYLLTVKIKNKNTPLFLKDEKRNTFLRSENVTFSVELHVPNNFQNTLWKKALQTYPMSCIKILIQLSLNFLHP